MLDVTKMRMAKLFLVDDNENEDTVTPAPGATHQKNYSEWDLIKF